MLLMLLACTASPRDSEPSTSDSGLHTGDSQVDAAPCEGVDAQVTDLEPAQLAAMLESKDFQLLNVHVPYAGQIGQTDAHIEYTDIDALEAHLDGRLDAPAVLYCLTGPMSRSATRALVDRGYCAIYDLPSGMVGWEQAGYPLED